MSITDELRKYAQGYKNSHDAWSGIGDELTAIADRIDAEHERGMADAYLSGTPTDEQMTELGWIRLPVDADGEYIRIGDVMAYADSTKPMEVVALVPPAVFLTEDGPRFADMCRHYHAPTVEDVLREFANEVYADADNKIRDRDFLCAKYAKRLKLAEGEGE